MYLNFVIDTDSVTCVVVLNQRIIARANTHTILNETIVILIMVHNNYRNIFNHKYNIQ